MIYEINFSSARSRKAIAAKRIGRKGSYWLKIGAAILIISSLAAYAVDFVRPSFISGAIGLICAMFALWYQRELSNIPASLQPRTLDDVLETGLLAGLKDNKRVTPSVLMQTAASQWQGRFICDHLLLDSQQLALTVGTDNSQLAKVWQLAAKLSEQARTSEINAAAVVAALILNSPPASETLVRQNLRAEDVVETFSWLVRLEAFMRESRPYFGGIGRDWAAGFTPTLDHFGQNISQAVEAGRGHFHSLAHADVLDSVLHNLDRSGAVAIVGDAGTGKTSLVWALAERLLKGQDPGLHYFQITSLNASMILSSAGDSLERTVLNLFSEAIHAGNIIIFLDEAELFFGKGAGAVDLSQILLPVLQNRRLKLITTFTPDEFQHLKAGDETLASLLNPVNVGPASPESVIKILEDSALTLEQRDNILITFQAVREALRLSDQYMQELAYPGKAINLLEQATAYAADKVMTAESVQQALEKIRGVKVSRAEGPETEVLLKLEDKIHTRMVNQERAVSVVASALRRGRAGVSDPKRPIGSFLFLGPTGVGKTELARSLAAVYFGDVQQMIRVDMTEYQQAEDVERLLEAGDTTDKSLILKIREQPFAVVLLDEIEKAHPNILNLLLQMLDEGRLTDKAGKPASFRNAIIITTSNAGSAEITERVRRGDKLESFERPLIDELIQTGVFRAELINRFDEIVLFRPLDQNELLQIAKLMLAEVNETLKRQNVSVQLSSAALVKLVSAGYDPQFGARPMRRVIAETVEDAVATRILKGEAQPGSIVNLDTGDFEIKK